MHGKSKKNWHDKAILAVHVSWRQTKHQLTINSSYIENKATNPIFLSCHKDEDKNKGATDESKKIMVSSFNNGRTKICYAFMASIYAEE